MKTATRKISIRLFLALAMGALIVGAPFKPAQAELSDRQFETLQRERKRDFEKYVKNRSISSEKELKAAEALREARKKQQTAQLENQKAFVKKMKRYSMEEIEARDRADEERLAKEAIKDDKSRQAFIRTRDTRIRIENDVSPVHPYQEFDIDMAREPESKVSHSATGSASSSEGF